MELLCLLGKFVSWLRCAFQSHSHVACISGEAWEREVLVVAMTTVVVVMTLIIVLNC